MIDEHWSGHDIHRQHRKVEAQCSVLALVGSLDSINGFFIKLSGLFKSLRGRTLELVAHQSTGPHEPPIDRPRLHKLMVVKIAIEPLEGDHPSKVMR